MVDECESEADDEDGSEENGLSAEKSGVGPVSERRERDVGDKRASVRTCWCVVSLITSCRMAGMVSLFTSFVTAIREAAT